MPPFGARQRPHQQATAPPPRQPPSRSEAFENIFGRPAGGHHLGHGPPSGVGVGVPGPGSHRPPSQNPYGQLAPLPPAGAPSYPRHYPPPKPPTGAQPSYPPLPPQQRPQQFGAPPPGPQPGYPPPPRDSYVPSEPYAAPYYDAAPPPPPAYNMPPYPRPHIPSGPGPAYGTPPPEQPRSVLPNRRASLTPSVAPSMYSTSGGYAQQSIGASRPPPSGYNGYSHNNDRLPHISALEQPQIEEDDPYGGIVKQPAPAGAPAGVAQNYGSASRSVSGTSTSTASTITSTAPPRASSIKQSVRPAPYVNTNVGPNRGPDTTPTSPADFVRQMNALALGGRETPGPLDDIPGIPDRNSPDIGSLRGPWEPPSEQASQQQYAVSSSRHMSNNMTGSNPRTLHHRMPSDSSIASSMYTVGAARVTPLSTIGPPVHDSPFASPATPTGSENSYTHRRLSSRKSMESTHSLPLPNTTESSPLPPGAATSAFDNRAMSFSGNSANRRDIVSQVRSSQGSLNESSRSLALTMSGPTLSPVASQHSLVRKLSQTQRQAALVNMPVVPALLSTVAAAFRQLVQPGEIHKEGITYKDAFDGRTAVTIIADIIKTPDRNLALLLGRALDAQKFFHDVTYAHRLRDTANEVYQFRERLVAPLTNNETAAMDSPSSDPLTLTRPASTSSAARSANVSRVVDSESSSSCLPPTGRIGPSTPVESDDSDDDLPNGVFTLLTDCYSPTCTRERLCYSINCPRRLEQMKRLNMKSAHPGLSRKIEEVIHDDSRESSGTLWIHSVSQEILDSVDDTEKKRQEAINELIYTERDFVRDLEYLRDSWVKPLRTLDVVDASRRDDFVRQVFWNVHDVLTVNQVLSERLTKRQKSQPVVQSIGDIFLECVPHFEPFVTYGAHQLFGKYEFEKEKEANPAFQKFVDETERKPESRKLELNGYLTKPTTRLGRYPLLLGAVLKYTPEDHQDKRDLTEAVKLIREYLSKVNEESGKSENIFELAQLEKQIVFRPHEGIDLRLRDKSRELVHKGPVKRRGGAQGENADLLAFLFDHAFLLVKSKWVNKAEQYKVYRRPIPLELLVLSTPEDIYNSTKSSTTSRAKLISRNNTKNSLGAGAHVPPKPESKHGFSMNIQHLGRKGYQLTLWVETYVSRKKWVECIEQQQQVLRDKSTVFVPETITEGFFGGLRRINCISPYDNGNRMIYGTDEGVYFSNLRDPKLREPIKVINLVDVTQVDVIEEFQLLIVLHERSVTTFPLDCLDPNDPNAALKRAKRISSHTSFFKSGICLGRTLVAVVKSSALSSTIKVLEPIDQNMRGKKPQGGFMKRLNGGQETLKVFKEFYIPLESFSVYFLKTKLCVGCQKGFEIVDLETLDMQSLLDPSDSSLDFVLKREGVKPMAIYRVESDFLLCYDDFAFYVNKNGWRSRPKWAIVWEGNPTSFALQYPYVVAFEPNFVEVRHVETGHLIQIIPGSGISCLFADMPPSAVNAPVVQNRPYMHGPGSGPPGMPGGNPYARPPPGYQKSGFPGPGGGLGAAFPQPHPYGGGGGPRPPMPGGYGMPPPLSMAPIRNFAFRPQIIFTSDDGHVQFLKLPPPQKRRRPSDSRSTRSFGP